MEPAPSRTLTSNLGPEVDPNHGTVVSAERLQNGARSASDPDVHEPPIWVRKWTLTTALLPPPSGSKRGAGPSRDAPDLGPDLDPNHGTVASAEMLQNDARPESDPDVHEPPIWVRI